MQDVVKTFGKRRDKPYEKMGSDPHHEFEKVRPLKHSSDGETGKHDMNQAAPDEEAADLHDSPSYDRQSEATASLGPEVRILHLQFPVTENADDELRPGGAPIIQSYDDSMDNAGAEIKDEVAYDAARYESARAVHDHMVSRVQDLQDDTVASLEDDKASVEDALQNRRAFESRAIRVVEEARKEAEEMEMEKRDVQDAAVAGHNVGVKRAVEAARMDMHDMVHAAVLNGGQDGMRAARERALAEGIRAEDEAQAQKSVEASAFVGQTAEQLEAVRENGKTTARLWRNDIEGADGLKNHMIREDAEHTAGDYGHVVMHDEKDIDNTVREGAGYVKLDRLADAVSR